MSTVRPLPRRRRKRLPGVTLLGFASLLVWIDASPLAGATDDLPTEPLAATAVETSSPPAPAHGLPFFRSYPFDEIGYASRSAKLTFDPHGRIAVVREGSFVALNDDVWINLSKEEYPGIARAITGKDKHLYFGSRGSWGTAHLSSSGKFEPRPLLSEKPPEWTRSAYFENLVATSEGVYFGSWEGVVFLAYGSQTPKYLETKNASCLIAIGDRVFVATRNGDILTLTRAGDLLQLESVMRGAPIVEGCTPLNNTQVLLCANQNELHVFDGSSIRRWTPEPGVLSENRIACILRLVDGSIAVAQSKNGLFIFTQDGRLRRAYTTSRFRQISDMANREKGVLWLTTEDSVLKVLNEGPLEDFGHDLGLVPSWPIPAEIGNKTYVTSAGILHEVHSSGSGRSATIAPSKMQIPGGIRHVTGNGKELFATNPEGVFVLSETGIVKLADLEEASKIALQGEDILIASSATQIAAFRRKDGAWREACPRVPGLGYTPIVHDSPHGMVVEKAAEGAALVRFDTASSEIRITRFRPWTDAGWTSVSVLGELLMFTGGFQQRCFLDLATGKWNAPADLEARLSASPEWIIRATLDRQGRLWGASNKGLVAFPEATQAGEKPRADADGFNYVSDLFPTLVSLPSGSLWITSHASLYRANTDYKPHADVPSRSRVVSIVEAATGKELWNERMAQEGLVTLETAKSGLSIRMFAGTYLNRRPPSYAYRMNGAEWTHIDSGSLLSFRELEEGNHELEIREADPRTAELPPIQLHLRVPAPWYRTLPAYCAYGTLALGALLGAITLSSRVARRRSQALEKLVRKRTEELEQAMTQLNEETRVSATLAERNRLAGEIHDSLQQGLSGALLQLDSTLALPDINTKVRTRMETVRSMLSFTRSEVQSAVWDKESPLLGDCSLEDALGKMVAHLNGDSCRVTVEIQGTARPLPHDTRHHLLRIAQEASTNSVRHAKAGLISIHLCYEPAATTLEIRDNGIGMDPSRINEASPGHFGLQGIRSRARRLKADLLIHSLPGQGTRIRVRVQD